MTVPISGSSRQEQPFCSRKAWNCFQLHCYQKEFWFLFHFKVYKKATQFPPSCCRCILLSVTRWPSGHGWAAHRCHRCWKGGGLWFTWGVFSRWGWLPWHSDRLRNMLQSSTITITSEQAEAVELKVFKTYTQHQKCSFSCGSNQKITEPCKFFTYVADGRALLLLLFSGPLFWETQPQGQFPALCKTHVSYTRSQRGSNLLCTRKGFMASLVHWEWCHIHGGCHISLRKCSLKSLSASFFMYDFFQIWL